MPFQPAPGDVHIDALLTMLSTAYMNEPNVYVADKQFPIVVVRKQSDKIAKYDKEFWFRDDAQLRAPATESEGSGFTVNTADTYFCQNYAFHKDIPDEYRRNADEPFNPDMEATIYVTDKLLMRREKAWAADFFKINVWATDATPANLWSDYALSDPISDIETGRDAIHASTARDPNTFTIGRQVWSKLKHHPDFIERIKYTQRGVLTTEIVASILEIERLFVGRAISATSNEAATLVLAYIFGKHGLLTFVPPRPSLMTPAAGYTFHWDVFGGLSYMRRLREEKALYDRIEGHTFFDQKALGTDLGYFFNGAVA